MPEPRLPAEVFLELSTGLRPEHREPVLATNDPKLIRGFLDLLARRLGLSPSPPPRRLRPVPDRGTGNDGGET
jgi:hypothetical protein